MTSIFFLIDATYCNILRWNYVRNQKNVLNFFFLDFRYLDSILNIFKKKATLIADVFLKIMYFPKNVVRSMSKESRLRGPFDK